MRSIRKIVSTPIKWAFKAALHKTLLRFPGGDPHSPIACVYCPELCRFSCPTAVVSGNDAVTPCNKMSLVYKAEKWPEQTLQSQPFWPIYDCTGCGRCTEYCLYGMPVAEQLFAARKKWKWEVAESASIQISDEEDLVGDLADELGDEVTAQRRLKTYLVKSLPAREPRSLYFLQQKGHSVPWASEDFFKGPVPAYVSQRLGGKVWLVHESVWLSRHLKRSSEITDGLGRLQGIAQLQMPFAHGQDCIDCGGEGAYPYLFPTQAKRMAQEIWERDQHRVGGILCFSQRCVEHFKKSLGPSIPIMGIEDLWKK